MIENVNQPEDIATQPDLSILTGFEIGFTDDLPGRDAASSIASWLTTASFVTSLRINFGSGVVVYADDRSTQADLLPCLTSLGRISIRLSQLHFGDLSCLQRTLVDFLCNHARTLRHLNLSDINVLSDPTVPEPCLVEFLTTIKALLDLKTFELHGLLRTRTQVLRIDNNFTASRKGGCSSSKLSQLKDWLTDRANTRIPCPIEALSFANRTLGLPFEDDPSIRVSSRPVP